MSVDNPLFNKKSFARLSFERKFFILYMSCYLLMDKLIQENDACHIVKRKDGFVQCDKREKCSFLCCRKCSHKSYSGCTIMNLCCKLHYCYVDKLYPLEKNKPSLKWFVPKLNRIFSYNMNIVLSNNNTYNETLNVYHKKGIGINDNVRILLVNLIKEYQLESYIPSVKGIIHHVKNSKRKGTIIPKGDVDVNQPSSRRTTRYTL